MEIEDAIIENESIIYSIIKKINGYQIKDDLYQVGVIGIINAYNNYDATKGVKFSTYAYFYILGEIKRYIRENRIIKISRDIANLGIRVERARDLITQYYGRDPTNKEIANYLGKEESKVEEAIYAKNYVSSIDEIISSDGKDLFLGDIIESPQPNIDELILLKEAIKSLNNTQQRIIKERYYMGKSQTEVAQQLGISQVKVYREEQKGLEKIRMLCN